MMRQVALGAVVAFFATVIALSVWEPKPVIEPAPPSAAPEAAPAPAFTSPQAFKPQMLKPEGMRHFVRAPVEIARPVAMPAVDAGTP